MPRTARFVLPHAAHHVVARGVHNTRLFRSGFDKSSYLKRFTLIAAQEHVTVHAYCLMDNHVHWLLSPASPTALARLFHRLHTWWAMRLNRQLKRHGHLFQARFFSTPLDDNHFWTAMRYVEVNPRRAGTAPRLQDWEFSSARAHLDGSPDPLVELSLEAWRQRFGSAAWRDFLQETDREADQRLQRSLAGCRPCGSDEWLRALEQKAHRRLAWSPPGRPASRAVVPAPANGACTAGHRPAAH